MKILNSTNKEFTLLIQGRLSKDTIQYYSQYTEVLPIIISTWVNNQIELNKLIDNVKVVTSELPPEPGHQNFYYQLFSTIAGLNFVSTKYVIKVRGDEYYNIPKLIECIQYPDKYIYTIPVFFRSFKSHPYHISDHLIAGTTNSITKMFKIALHNSNNTPKTSCETGLTRAHMVANNFTNFGNFKEGKNKMRELFKIISLDNLEPYKITANCFNTTWYSEINKFYPLYNNSIDDLNNL